MATLTIRNIPDDLIGRVKESAASHGRSMEQELRDLLQTRYAPRSEVLQRIRSRWKDLPGTDAQEAAAWMEEGRH